MIPDQPILLEPNLVQRPYRGGQKLAAFRGADIVPDSRVPEDWLASTATVFGKDTVGLTRLADGHFLRDAIRQDPVSYLGRPHVDLFGPDPALLVKLLDTQQRLSVHAHPDRAFARKHLGSRYGKSEAWYIVATEPEALVHLGFREPIREVELLAIIDRGQGSSLLEKMHPIPVSPGDILFVPGGTPHSIGAGIFMIELQEPSDLLVRLETSGYSVSGMPSDLGLGFTTAITAINCNVWDSEQIARNVRRGVGEDPLPAAASPFFRLEHPGVASDVELEEGYKILICVEGKGELRTEKCTTPVVEGQCYLLPWATGPVKIFGDLEFVCCRPADPAAAQSFDPEIGMVS